MRGHGAFGLDLIPGAANALLADFTDGLVTCFIGFACFIAFFGKLYHNEFTVSAILSVELHDGMGGGGGAREEIEDNRVIIRGHVD